MAANKIEIVKQNRSKYSLIGFTEGERYGEMIGSIHNETLKISLIEERLTPEVMILLGTAFYEKFKLGK